MQNKKAFSVDDLFDSELSDDDFSEVVFLDDGDSDDVVFSESETEPLTVIVEDLNDVGYSEDEDSDSDLIDQSLIDQLLSEIDDLEDSAEDVADVAKQFLPGTDVEISEEKPDEDKDKENEAIDTTWENDRDVEKFMDYLRSAWENIPRHDGKSISGCERAINYLNNLNKEISEAIRKASAGQLDEFMPEIEEYRVNILKGVVALKKKITEINNSLTKKSSVEQNIIVKEAGTAQFTVTVSAFERAICGMLINATVSAGHPFDQVYDYLKKKYKFTEREELSILQILKDMGQPIFKDRGSLGVINEDGDDSKHGVDFMKNYFA